MYSKVNAYNFSEAKSSGLPNESLKKDDRGQHVNLNKIQHPPMTYEEFLHLEDVEIWPLPLNEETLKIEDSHVDIPLLADVELELKESIPFGFERFDKFEKKTNNFGDRLKCFSMYLSASESCSSDLPPELLSTSGTECLEKKTSSEKSYNTAQKVKAKITWNAVTEKEQEKKSRNIDYQRYEGFVDTQFLKLPNQLDALELLEKVVEAQSFQKRVFRVWKRLFLSTGCVSIFQDTFWWFFLRRFQPNDVDQNKLFSRIADRYVSLFLTIHPSERDKFFMYFPRCLAQCVYLAFKVSFPESHPRFDEGFVAELSCIISEWVTGVKPPSGSWKKWPWDNLCSPPGVGDELFIRKVVSKSRRSLALAENLKFNIEDYLGDSMAPSNVWTPIQSNTALKSNETVYNNIKQGRGDNQGLSCKKTERQRGKLLSIPFLKKSSSSIDSAPAGPGPDLERVLFNTCGRSPLVAHHLYMKNLRSKEDVGKTVKRSEIHEEPPKAITFKEIINQSKQNVKVMRDQRTRSEFKTQEDILKLHRIYRLALSKVKPPDYMLTDKMEVKILSDKMLEDNKKRLSSRFHLDVDLISKAEANYSEEGDDSD